MPNVSMRVAGLPRAAARLLIRLYQLSFSAFTGRQCRHMPTCSAFMDEAMARHGFWAGGWMGAGRLCRCHPWGTAGYDPVPDALPAGSRWSRPWRYARWRGPLRCETATEAPRRRGD